MNYTIKRLEDGTFNAEIGDDVIVWEDDQWSVAIPQIFKIDDEGVTVIWNADEYWVDVYPYSHVRHPVGSKGYFRLQNKLMREFLENMKTQALTVDPLPEDNDPSNLHKPSYFTHVAIAVISNLFTELKAYEFDDPLLTP